MIAADALRSIAKSLDSERLSDADVLRIALKVVELQARHDAEMVEALKPLFDEWLTPEQAADVMQISRDTLTTLEREGLLVPSRVGSRIVRYSRRDIAALMAAHRGGAS